MAFDGNLFYVWNSSTNKYDAFPTKYMFKESYKGALEVQDLDSTRDANGVLDRTTLDHTAYTIEFSTPPCWNDKMGSIFNFFKTRYVNTKQRKLKVKFYVNEFDEYQEGYMYMATPTFNIARVDGNKIFYNSTTVNLIQY